MFNKTHYLDKMENLISDAHNSEKVNLKYYEILSFAVN